MDAEADEIWPRSGWALWALGAVAGLVLTTVLGFVVLMGLTSRPQYVRLAGPAGTLAAGSTAEGEVTLAATEFAFEPVSVEVTGAVRLVLDNQGLIFHNLEIEGVEGFILEADPAQQASGTIQLDPGRYTIFCGVPGHREAGMEAELVISEAEVSS